MLAPSTGYAATALGCITAMNGQPVLVKEIAEACSLPAPYLAKIIHTLARKGIVTTQRGVGGGVALAADPDKLSLYDVCVALDDPITQKKCMLGTAECSDERACPAHQFWSSHRAAQLRFLETTTIGQLAAFELKRMWNGRQTGPAKAGLTVNGRPTASGPKAG